MAALAFAKISWWLYLDFLPIQAHDHRSATLQFRSGQIIEMIRKGLCPKEISESRFLLTTSRNQNHSRVAFPFFWQK
jgi:hypothetical protein